MSRPWSTPESSYPSHPKLSRSDELAVLRSGAPLHWFFPFAVLGEVRTAQPNRMPYGLVHWYIDADGRPRTDARTFYAEEDLRWAADWLYLTHRKRCRCVAIFYWTPETVNYRPEAS